MGVEWVADVSVGDWVRERLDDPWQYTMHDVVPRGFDAYARVFHPAWRDRPVGAEWPRESYSDRAWDRFHAAHPDLETTDEPVTWEAVAAAMGTTMHAGAQWGALTRFDPWGNRENDPRDADGWRYHDPEQGQLPPEDLTFLASTLAAHTTTPDDGIAALWEGHGGLLGFVGETPRGTAWFGWLDGAPVAHNAMLNRSMKDRFNDVFRKPSWQDGILSREISEGPRLQLPNRAYVLFSGGIDEFRNPDWVARAAWRERLNEQYGAPADDPLFAPTALTPSILWPADHAWVSVTEVDYDSTIVGGSRELVAALLSTPGLEVWEIPVGTALHDGTDEVNG